VKKNLEITRKKAVITEFGRLYHNLPGEADRNHNNQNNQNNPQQTMWCPCPDVNRVKVKVKFSLERTMKAQRGSRGIALFFL
jgi:hypothetical protein